MGSGQYFESVQIFGLGLIIWVRGNILGQEGKNWLGAKFCAQAKFRSGMIFWVGAIFGSITDGWRNLGD